MYLAELEAKVEAVGQASRARGGFPERSGEGRSHLAAGFRAATN